jgi:hypothetical protein
MKSKMFIKILLLIVIAGNIAGCKKYPDGPWLSLRSAKGRLYGQHTLTKYTVNGVDSLSRYQDSLCTNFDFYKADIADVCNMSGSRNDGWESTLCWEWVLEDNNKLLQITFSGGQVPRMSGTGLFKDNVLPSWQILKLKHDDIILQTTYNGKVYLIELTGD